MADESARGPGRLDPRHPPGRLRARIACATARTPRQAADATPAAIDATPQTGSRISQASPATAAAAAAGTTASARAARRARSRAAAGRTPGSSRSRSRAPAKVVRGVADCRTGNRTAAHGLRNASASALQPASPTSHGAGATSVPPSAAAKPSWSSMKWFQRCASRRIQDSAAPARGSEA